MTCVHIVSESTENDIDLHEFTYSDLHYGPQNTWPHFNHGGTPGLGHKIFLVGQPKPLCTP